MTCLLTSACREFLQVRHLAIAEVPQHQMASQGASSTESSYGGATCGRLLSTSSAACSSLFSLDIGLASLSKALDLTIPSHPASGRMLAVFADYAEFERDILCDSSQSWHRAGAYAMPIAGDSDCCKYATRIRALATKGAQRCRKVSTVC